MSSPSELAHQLLIQCENMHLDLKKYFVHLLLLTGFSIAFQGCNEILLGGNSGSGNVISNATNADTLAAPTEADIDSDALGSDAEAAPVASIPLPENDSSGNSLASFLVISSPDLNGEVILQIPQSDIPADQQELANQTFAVTQIDPEDSSTESTDEVGSLWLELKSMWRTATRWMESKVIQTANALSLDLPVTETTDSEGEDYCSKEGVTCITLNDQGYLDPINLELSYVPDEENFISPKFYITPLSENTPIDNESFELESLKAMTFASDVPASDSARFIDTSINSMVFSNSLGIVKGIENSNQRFVMKNGSFDDGYQYSMIPNIDENDSITNFTIEPLSSQFIFQSNNQISATNLDRTYHTLSDAGISSKSSCTTKNNCTPSIMKNMIYQANGNSLTSDIYYSTKAIHNGLTIGAIHSLYEKTLPIVYNFTPADFDSNGDPIFVRNAVNFATQFPGYGVAIFKGLTYPDSDLSPYLDDLSIPDLDLETRLMYQANLQQAISDLIPTETTYLVAARVFEKNEPSYSSDKYQNFSKVRLNLSQYGIDASEIRDLKIFTKQSTSDANDGYGVFITDEEMYFFSFDAYDSVDPAKVELIETNTKKFSIIFGIDYSPTSKTLDVLTMNNDGSIHVEIFSTKNIETENPKQIFDVNVNKALFPNQKINLRPKNFMVYKDPNTDTRHLTFFSGTLKSMLSIPLEAKILEELSAIQ